LIKLPVLNLGQSDFFCTNTNPMKLGFHLLVLLLLLIDLPSFGQSETFDITTYTPPKGWKKEQKDF